MIIGDLTDIGFRTEDTYNFYLTEGLKRAYYDRSLNLLRIQYKKNTMAEKFVTEFCFEVCTLDHLEEALETFKFSIPVRIPIKTR